MTDRISIWTKGHTLIAYFLLAYGISWAVEIPLALKAHNLIRTSMPFSIHYLAAYGPLLSALIVTGLSSGLAGLKELLGRVLKWRVGLAWWLAAFSPILLYLLATLILVSIFGRSPNPAMLGQVDYLPDLGWGASILWFLTFGIGEETGWRGFALPRLQKKPRCAFRHLHSLGVMGALAPSGHLLCL